MSSSASTGVTPSLKHHSTWAGESEPVAIPLRLSGVGGQGSVGAVVSDEVCEVGTEDVLAAHRAAPISPQRSSAWAIVPRLDRRLETREIRVLKRRAAELFAVTFVEPVETHGVENLPEGLPVAENPDECSFASSAVQLERNSHQVLPSCGRLSDRPRCKAAGHKGGACHLREGHAEQHECNAVGGQAHSWK